MNLSELRKLINNSTHSDLFNDFEVHLNYPISGVDVNLVGFTAIYQWFNKQDKGWEKFEDNLPSVEDALVDLKTAWNESLKAEDRFKVILNEFL